MSDPSSISEAINTEILGDARIRGLKTELAALKQQVRPNYYWGNKAESHHFKDSEADNPEVDQSGAEEGDGGDAGEVPGSNVPPVSSEGYDNTTPSTTAEDSQWMTSALQAEQAKGDNADSQWVEFLESEMSNLQAVQATSRAVQASARPTATPDVMDRIARAQNPAEVAAIMAEAGLTP